jgi:hypothetical protein
VRLVALSSAVLCGTALLMSGCTEPPTAELVSTTQTAAGPTSKVTSIDAGAGAAKKAQAALINAKAGDVIELGEGRFDFTSTLSLDVSHVTLRGKGPDKTILTFKDQGAGTGGEGLLITSKDDVTLADLAIEDARGDGI